MQTGFNGKDTLLSMLAFILALGVGCFFAPKDEYFFFNFIFFVFPAFFLFYCHFCVQKSFLQAEYWDSSYIFAFIKCL